MPLTGKQRRVLRGAGQSLDPMLFIGKEGVNEATVSSAEEVFKRRELIKVRVLNNAPGARDEFAEALAQATKSEEVGGVGHTFLLYRKNADARWRVELPRATE